MDGNNYWNIPIVPSTETRKDSRLKGENFSPGKTWGMELSGNPIFPLFVLGDE